MAITDWPIPFEHPLYGWYHVLWIVIAVAASIALAIYGSRKCTDKQCDRIVLIFGITLLVLEVYKQIFIIRDCYPGYDWNALPYQFCSTPMFIMVLAPLAKNAKIKDALYKFLAFYGCLAGISVLAYPTVVSEAKYLTMILHTMIWHVSMIVVGVFVIAAKGYGKHLRRELLPGMAVLLTLIGIATVLNFLLPRLIPNDPWINLFYISYYHGSSLPILSSFYRYGDGVLQWLWLLIAYILAFSLGAAFIWLCAKLVNLIKKNACR